MIDRAKTVITACAVAIAAAFAVFVLIGGPPETAGTAPPPYTDPNTTVVNALGGLGQSQGYQKSVTSGAGLDMILGLTAVAPELNSVPQIRKVRTYTITLLGTPAANGALCARLGPDNNLGADPNGTATLTCPDTNAVGGTNGGCYMWIAGQSCTFTIRPIEQCVDVASCHIPLWALASAAAADVKVVTSVAW